MSRRFAISAMALAAFAAIAFDPTASFAVTIVTPVHPTINVPLQNGGIRLGSGTISGGPVKISPIGPAQPISPIRRGSSPIGGGTGSRLHELVDRVGDGHNRGFIIGRHIGGGRSLPIGPARPVSGPIYPIRPIGGGGGNLHETLKVWRNSRFHAFDGPAPNNPAHTGIKDVINTTVTETVIASVICGPACGITVAAVALNDNLIAYFAQ